MALSPEIQNLLEREIGQTPADRSAVLPLSIQGVMPRNFFLGQEPDSFNIPVFVDREHGAEIPIHGSNTMLYGLQGFVKIEAPTAFTPRITRITGAGSLVWDIAKQRGGFQMTVAGYPYSEDRAARIIAVRVGLPWLGIKFALAQYTHEIKKNETSIDERFVLGVSVTDNNGFTVGPDLPSDWPDQLRTMQYAYSTLRIKHPLILARLSNLPQETIEQLRQLRQPEVQSPIIVYSEAKR